MSPAPHKFQAATCIFSTACKVLLVGVKLQNFKKFLHKENLMCHFLLICKKYRYTNIYIYSKIKVHSNFETKVFTKHFHLKTERKPTYSYFRLNANLIESTFLIYFIIKILPRNIRHIIF